MQNDSSDRSWLTSLRADLPASFVVFLVALPLCMGVAIASGVPVAAGLITGIVGGLVVGLLAGSPLQVSGPAAGLTVIVYAFVSEHGLPLLGLVVLVAGGFQVAAGMLKLGQWFRAVSPAVIQGMLAGIGVLIFASQFHVMVDDEPPGDGLENLLTIPSAVAKGLPLPTLGSREEREFRTVHLQQFGHIHEMQQDLEEEVGERVIEGSEGEEAAAESAELLTLVDRQRAVTDQLVKLVGELNDFGLTKREGDDARHLAEASELAVRKSRAALASLEAGDVATAKKRQLDAAVSLTGLLQQLKNHDWAAKIGVVTILVILAWQGFAPKKLKIVPAPLLAVLAGTIMAAWLALPVLYVEVPDNLLEAVHIPTWTVIKSVPLTLILQTGLVIAVVASAETLLCATAVDQMHQGPRTNYDRELFSQGIGNLICGFLGALPMTGVIVRSAANVQAGAKSRSSAVLHGAWLLTFVALLGWLLTMIPTACLAAILVYTGYKLVNPKSIAKLWQYGRGEVAIYLVTVVTIVVKDLLTGVLLGIALASARLLYTFSHLQIRVEKPAAGKTVLHLTGTATFLRLPKLAAVLEQVLPTDELHVDFDQLDYIDHACIDLLMNWEKSHTASGGRLVLDWENLQAIFRKENGPTTPSMASTVAAPTNGHAAPREPTAPSDQATAGRD